MVQKVTLPRAVYVQLFGLHALLLGLFLEIRSPEESAPAFLIAIGGVLAGLVGLLYSVDSTVERPESSESDVQQ